MTDRPSREVLTDQLSTPYAIGRRIVELATTLRRLGFGLCLFECDFRRRWRSVFNSGVYGRREKNGRRAPVER